jgi:tRNA (guanine37-N1)-methyltransferase
MQFEVFTLFPEVFEAYFQCSILQRALQRNLVKVNIHNIRNWTADRHHVTDDEPFGGGGGMVLKPEPIFNAVESVLGLPLSCPIILLSPQGRTFTQAIAQEFYSSNQNNPAQPSRLALICGRYEGVDERVRQHLATDEISIGDYVLTGGELAAMVVIDTVTRLIPGVLGNPDGAIDDSHASSLLEYPHYTRPAEFRGWRVPEVLTSGDHGKISKWRREQALRRTWLRRPDLLEKAPLTENDRRILEQIRAENQAESAT